MSTFQDTIAIDANKNMAAPGTVGQVFDPADTAATTPLAIFDLNGIPLSGNQLVVNNQGIVEAFRYDGLTVVDWVSGDFRIPIVAGDQVPAGGGAGQVLSKATGADYDLAWIDPPEGGGGGIVTITWADMPAMSNGTIQKNGGTWPTRPTTRTDVSFFWKGPAPGPVIDTGSTPGGLLDNIDTWLESS